MSLEALAPGGKRAYIGGERNSGSWWLLTGAPKPSAKGKTLPARRYRTDRVRPNLRQFMAYLGLVPSEHSSGSTRRQGGITKAGNGAACAC
jgi:hypothetical protein